MAEFWICLGKISQGLEYASNCKRPRTQIMASLWICKGYAGCWICLNKPEYAVFSIQNTVTHLRWSLLQKKTVKSLNSRQLQVLKNLSVIKRCPLLGGNLKYIVTLGAKHFVRYSSHVRYLGCPLLGGFIVIPK